MSLRPAQNLHVSQQKAKQREHGSNEKSEHPAKQGAVIFSKAGFHFGLAFCQSPIEILFESLQMHVKGVLEAVPLAGVELIQHIDKGRFGFLFKDFRNAVGILITTGMVITSMNDYGKYSKLMSCHQVIFSSLPSE
jgi:hypothetical protein